MVTTTARSLYKILTSNIYIVGATFHAGSECLVYPWGSDNHVKDHDFLLKKAYSYNAPDDVSMSAMTHAL